jgi:hypothetical protein
VGYRAHALRVGVLLRLKNIIGFPYTLGWSRGEVLLAVFVILLFVLVTQVAAALVTHRSQPILDWFATVTTILVVLMFLWPPQFHYHFAAFLTPFLALTLALPVSRLLDGLPESAASPAAKRQLTWSAVGAAAAILVVLAGLQARFESGVPHVIGPIPARIEAIIPPGACVLTDQVSVTLAANRFVSTDPNCPQMVDSLGTDLALSNGLRPTTGAGKVPQVAAFWHSALSRAQYLILTATNTRRIAWTPALVTYLNDNFVQVYKSPRKLVVYVRKGLRVP